MRFLWLLLLVSPLVYGQNKTEYSPTPDYKAHALLSFPKTVLNGTIDKETVASYLNSHLENLRAANCGLKFNYVTESPGGYHFSFSQTYLGIEVYQSEIKANVDHSGMARSILDNSFDSRTWNITGTPANENAVVVVDKNSGKAYFGIRAIEHNSAEVIYVNGNRFYSRCINSYSDSLVTGNVFMPDPLTSSHTLFTGTDLDNGNANNTWLDNQLQSVNFYANYAGGVFSLENSFVKVVDFDSPQVAPAVSNLPQFFFNRSQNGFEDVNAYYHINKVREHIEGLGYNLADHLVWIDPHGTYDDNSYFAPAYSPPRIFYGIGGIDDAEDADVVTHEYGHFISFNAAPNSNVGLERNSLDEGFGDYIAASYSKAIDTFKSEWVFNWDGHNNYWNGRVVNSNKVYPNDKNGNIYNNAEIWSSPLMALRDELGRETTDSLIFETHYGYSINMAMDDAAYLMLDVDDNLMGGKYYCPIYKHMMEHGFFPFLPNNPCGFSGISDEQSLSVSFLQNGNSFALVNPGGELLNILLLDISGREINRFTESEQDYYYRDALPAGMYVVNVQAKGVSKSFKWCKVQ